MSHPVCRQNPFVHTSTTKQFQPATAYRLCVCCFKFSATAVVITKFWFSFTELIEILFDGKFWETEMGKWGIRGNGANCNSPVLQCVAKQFRLGNIHISQANSSPVRASYSVSISSIKLSEMIFRCASISRISYDPLSVTHSVCHTSHLN